MKFKVEAVDLDGFTSEDHATCDTYLKAEQTMNMMWNTGKYAEVRIFLVIPEKREFLKSRAT